MCSTIDHVIHLKAPHMYYRCSTTDHVQTKIQMQIILFYIELKKNKTLATILFIDGEYVQYNTTIYNKN